MTFIVNAAISTRTQAASQRAIRHVRSASQRTHASVGRLSSGLRVRSSADGSAVLSSTEVARASQTGLQRGMRNAQEAISMLQTAESGIASMADAYMRLRELAVAASGTELSVKEREFMEGEYQEIRLEAKRIAEVTAYGDNLLLDGTGGSAGNGSFTFQIGFQSEAAAQANIKIANQVNATLHTGTGVKSVAHARRAIDVIDDALHGKNGLHETRAKIGSAINALSSGMNFLMEQSSHFQTAIGDRRDLDIAEESAALSREQVLQNAGVAMLSQANAQSSVALRLLG